MLFFYMTCFPCIWRDYTNHDITKSRSLLFTTCFRMQLITSFGLRSTWISGLNLNHALILTQVSCQKTFMLSRWGPKRFFGSVHKRFFLSCHAILYSPIVRHLLIAVNSMICFWKKKITCTNSPGSAPVHFKKKKSLKKTLYYYL